MSFYTKDELLAAGFSSVGNNVRISKKSSLYVISGSIGNNVRIDDFCVLKGNIILESYNHIAAFCLLSGVCGSITLKAGAGLSSGVHVYTGSDDYSADVLNNPTVPQEYTKTNTGDVLLGYGSIVGCQSVLLPKSTIGDGASVGAHCLIFSRVPPGAVMVSGSGKAKKVKERNSLKIVSLIQQLMRNT